jgi:molecular chaperone GrpE
MAERGKQAKNAEEAGQASSADVAGEPEAPVSGRPDEERPVEESVPQEPPAGGEEDSPPEASDSEARAVEHDLDELLAKARERDEYLSVAQRTQADFENYRKRAAKDLAGAEARGVAKLARELLPAIDNLQLALNAAGGAEGEKGQDGGDGKLLEGLRLVQAQLEAALARLGIEAYSPEGEPFDPSEH